MYDLLYERLVLHNLALQMCFLIHTGHAIYQQQPVEAKMLSMVMCLSYIAIVIIYILKDSKIVKKFQATADNSN